MDQWNERNTIPVVVSFFDDVGDPVTPSSAAYRIVDKRSGAEVLASTPLTGLSTTKEIIVTEAQNAILSARHASEIKALAVVFAYGSGRQGLAQYEWETINLYGASATAPA